MKESSSNRPPYTDRIRSWARTHAYGGTKRSTGSSSNPTLPLSNPSQPKRTASHQQEGIRHQNHGDHAGNDYYGPDGPVPNGNTVAKADGDNTEHVDQPNSPTSKPEEPGSVLSPESPEKERKKKRDIPIRFYRTTKKILFHSWLNVGLVLVPVGIAIANIPNANPGATFGVNAVAIIPLAALLSYATESVARKMGDTIGALLNVTFGNAVELIIL
jgi:Ca2+:H+ antiporter